jgi:hypothetical protein
VKLAQTLPGPGTPPARLVPSEVEDGRRAQVKPGHIGNAILNRHFIARPRFTGHYTAEVGLHVLVDTA